MMPNYYLSYFYTTDHKLAEQDQWPPVPAEQVMAIEADLLKEYADPGRSQPPDDLMKRGGAYYSTLATQLLNAHYNDLNETHVVNTPHRGAVPGWPRRLGAGDAGCACAGRVRAAARRAATRRPVSVWWPRSKSYELLTVEAAVHGDRDAAYQALLVHPLGPQADKVQAVLDDMLETNRQYLPQFFQETGVKESGDRNQGTDRVLLTPDA